MSSDIIGAATIPRDASGNYTLPAGNPVVGGTIIQPAWANSTLDDISLALTASVNIQGTKSMIGPLKLPDGNLVAPALGFNSNNDVGLYYESNALKTTINGTTEAVQDVKGLSLSSSFSCADPLDNINVLDNSNFYYAQRGTAQTLAGINSIDRWRTGFSGGGIAMSQSTFPQSAAGVPGYPGFYCTCVSTGVAGAGNYNVLSQYIERLQQFAGGKATLSFWARADSPKNMGVNVAQYYTSAAETVTVPGQAISLSTVFQRYSATFDVPAIAASPAVDGTGFLALFFWFSAGSTYATASGSTPTQSGTFDIVNVQLQQGELASAYERPSNADNLRRCRRFYEKSFDLTTAPNNFISAGATTGPCVTVAGTIGTQFLISYKETKKSTPASISLYSAATSGGAGAQIQNTNTATPFTGSNVIGFNSEGFCVRGTPPAASVAGNTLTIQWAAEVGGGF